MVWLTLLKRQKQTIGKIETAILRHKAGSTAPEITDGQQASVIFFVRARLLLGASFNRINALRPENTKALFRTAFFAIKGLEITLFRLLQVLAIPFLVLFRVNVTVPVCLLG